MDPFGTSATLGHTALDAAGLIPGVGNVFDAVNALWYLAQGDWTNAGLSAIAVIPLVGGITSGTKIAVKTVKAADELADAAKVAEKSANKISDLTENMKNWLGDGAKVITNKNGDKIFISADGTKRIRFDINNTSPHNSPHGHIEQLTNGKWVKSGPIYPVDVPHN